MYPFLRLREKNQWGLCLVPSCSQFCRYVQILSKPVQVHQKFRDTSRFAICLAIPLQAKRFLFLMFSSNAILTTLFQFHLPKENVQWSLYSMGFFTTSKSKINLICTLSYRCLQIWIISRGICHAMGTPVLLFLIT